MTTAYLPFSKVVNSKSRTTYLLHHYSHMLNHYSVAIVNAPMGSATFYNRPDQMLNVELDVETRLKADVLKDRIRIKQFFIDFDRLRKGTFGEAGVSILEIIYSCI